MQKDARICRYLRRGKPTLSSKGAIRCETINQRVWLKLLENWICYTGTGTQISRTSDEALYYIEHIREASSDHVWESVDYSSTVSINLLDVGIDLLSGGRVLKGYLCLLVESGERKRGRQVKLQYNSKPFRRACVIGMGFSLNGRIKAQVAGCRLQIISWR